MGPVKGIRTYAELEGRDASDLGGQVAAQAERVRERLRDVRHVVAVASGKGGVGKSLVTAALAVAAGRRGRRAALLDADLNGPTSARLLGLESETLRLREDAVVPPRTEGGVAVMSTSLLLEEGVPLTWREPGSESFVWRGAQERGVVREFLSDVAWGPCDLLLVDLPPGTQRMLELWELVPRLAGVVAVTLPSEASRASVARGLELCRRRGIPLLGLVENMAGVRCGACGAPGPLFPGDAGDRLAAAFGVPLLGRIPFAARTAELAEAGRLAEALGTDEGAGPELRAVGDAVLARLESEFTTAEGEDG